MKNTDMPAEQQSRSFFAKKDLVIVAVLLVVAAAGFAAKYFLTDRNAKTEAEIYYNSQLVKTVELRPGLNETFAVPGQPDVILEVQDGKIRFKDSTCPDKICIKAGFLSRPGESAACLPNKVAVKITALGNTDTGGADTYIS